MIAAGLLHDTDGVRPDAEMLGYLQYDAVTVTLGASQLRNVGRVLAEFAEQNRPIARSQVRALFEARIDSHEVAKNRIFLTTQQYDDLMEYIAQGNYCRTADSAANGATVVLAFSFGEAPDVNLAIASKVRHFSGSNPSVSIYAQWEVADLLCGFFPTGTPRLTRSPRPTVGTATQDHIMGHEPRPVIHRIGLDAGSNYITTKEVVQKFKHMYEGDWTTAKVFLVCQAWHAPRCEQICREANLNVVGGAFVDQFSPRDPQPWVRDVLSHLIKESRNVRAARGE